MRRRPGTPRRRPWAEGCCGARRVGSERCLSDTRRMRAAEVIECLMVGWRKCLRDMRECGTVKAGELWTNVPTHTCMYFVLQLDLLTGRATPRVCHWTLRGLGLACLACEQLLAHIEEACAGGHLQHRTPITDRSANTKRMSNTACRNTCNDKNLASAIDEDSSSMQASKSPRILSRNHPRRLQNANSAERARSGVGCTPVGRR